MSVCILDSGLLFFTTNNIPNYLKSMRILLTHPLEYLDAKVPGNLDINPIREQNIHVNLP